MARLKALFNWLTKTKIGYFIILLTFFWLKNYIVYLSIFILGVVGSTQNFLLLFYPIPAGIILLGICLFFKGRKAYWLALLVDTILSMWLFANILYLSLIHI